jgi:hypothetical protein
MANQGGSFLKRLASFFDTAERNNQRLPHDPLRIALAIRWLDPDFPIWLMRLPAIVALLKINGFPEKDSTENKIRERIRDNGGSYLVHGSQLLVKEIGEKVETGKSSFAGMGFPLYISRSEIFPRLREHIDGLISRYQ